MHESLLDLLQLLGSSTHAGHLVFAYSLKNDFLEIQAGLFLALELSSRIAVAVPILLPKVLTHGPSLWENRQRAFAGLCEELLFLALESLDLAAMSKLLLLSFPDFSSINPDLHEPVPIPPVNQLPKPFLISLQNLARLGPLQLCRVINHLQQDTL